MASAFDLAAIQSMHDSKTVTREGLTGWYRWYKDKLPSLRPERSEIDLLLTLATWMELTERGSQPEFPYDYGTNLDFSSVDLDSADRASLTWLLGVLVIAIGLVVVFSELWLGLGLVVAGVVVQWLLFKLRGGATAVGMKDAQVRRQVERALEWVQTHQLSKGF